MKKMNFSTIYKKARFILLLLIAGVFLPGCKSFIEVDLPSSQLTNELVFQDAATAEAALIDVLGKLRGEFSGSTNSIAGTTLNCGVYADELIPYLSFSEGVSGQFYHNNLLPDNSYVSQIWSGAYNLIFAANSILEGVNKADEKAISVQDKEKIIGETLFLRAFINLYLVQLFGDIPYITSTDYQLNKTANRMAAPEVMKQLVEDLKKAIDYLPVTYSSEDRVRPNAWVARALLARVYLYMGEWADAEQTATDLIENPLFDLQDDDDISLVFHKDSPETIWQFSPQEANYPTNEARLYYFTTVPPTSYSLSEYLVQAFSPMDKRLEKWILPVDDSQGHTYFYAQKYKNRIYGENTTELSIQFRLAEQYLIRAECRIKVGKIEEGRSDLNKIRNRAGTGALESDNPDVLLNELLEERYRELFLEYPHRLFDVIRMDRTDILKVRKTGWDEDDRHWPIPEKELELNPHLKPQNAGYN